VGKSLRLPHAINQLIRQHPKSQLGLISGNYFLFPSEEFTLSRICARDHSAIHAFDSIKLYIESFGMALNCTGVKSNQQEWGRMVKKATILLPVLKLAPEMPHKKTNTATIASSLTSLFLSRYGRHRPCLINYGLHPQFQRQQITLRLSSSSFTHVWLYQCQCYMYVIEQYVQCYVAYTYTDCGLWCIVYKHDLW
jgi:hypothetical protein